MGEQKKMIFGITALLTAGSMLMGAVIWAICLAGVSVATLPGNVLWLTVGFILIMYGGAGFTVLLQTVFDE